MRWHLDSSSYLARTRVASISQSHCRAGLRVTLETTHTRTRTRTNTHTCTHNCAHRHTHVLTYAHARVVFTRVRVLSSNIPLPTRYTSCSEEDAPPLRLSSSAKAWFCGEARLEFIFLYPGAFRLSRRSCVWKSTGKKDARTKITVCRRCACKGQHIG